MEGSRGMSEMKMGRDEVINMLQRLEKKQHEYSSKYAKALFKQIQSCKTSEEKQKKFAPHLRGTTLKCFTITPKHRSSLGC